ncbi:globin domain-containing protein [Jannaschia pohangensis]|uniref:Nitric oxide dioxygenase n=1 Tax=Jannaschia pohangensis TaxID=390807 RepID=A0A1I3HEN0_9RHOB|nr:globin domain-containing protein [Jannaschia pohangensis]SFI34195.1 nitric oxide dioxygenase [Jannaschia pohangensis]
MDGLVTNTQARLLSRSLRRISENGAPLARSFYAELFSAHPEVRPMFHSDLSTQYAKFEDMLVVLVADVLNPGVILRPLQDLAKRHVEYGVTREMYPIVGDIMMRTLRTLDAAPLTGDELEAWDVLLGRVNAFLMDETLNHTA